MNQKTKFLLILFISAILIYFIISSVLFSSQNQILESQIPIWQGERDKPYTNYIIEDTIIKYNTINNADYVYLNTDYGVVQVFLSFLKDKIFYKRCSYNIGDKVKYAGAFSGAYRENIINKGIINITVPANIKTYFVLKRELC